MLTFKCKNCGGEMSVGEDGGLLCEYCGSRYYFTDRNLSDYRSFRLLLLNYLRGVKDEKTLDLHDESNLWDRAEEASFTTKDGTEISLYYLHSSVTDGVTVYLTQNAVIYHFPRLCVSKADRLVSVISRFEFPPADMKDLKKCCPCITGRYELDNGDVLIACQRNGNFFPLQMLGALQPEHTAWVMSRLENICCLLEYNNMSHNGITLDSVFVNPFTHQAALFGAWWGAGQRTDKDLVDIRAAGRKALGIYYDTAPALFKKFLNEKPAPDAFADFEKWDNVITSPEGFNGRRFTKYTDKI